MSELLGRCPEISTLKELLTKATAGRSGVLVVRGVAGIGKTALLEDLCATALRMKFRVEFSTGCEPESEFAFAGLHQFCSPFLEHLGTLPEPQQTALGVALGVQSGPTPDRFLVGLAVLTLLAEAAEDDPLLCVIDDAQWLDRASAEVVAFVARRLGADRLVMVFGERTGTGGSVFDGIPELKLRGLDDAAARQLLDAAVRTPLDDEVRDRITAEARGNPLALLELPANLPSVRLAGGFQLPDLSDVSSRVESGFQVRSRDLPEATRLLLLAAAAEPTGDPVLLYRAADKLGLAPDSAAPAEAAGLIDIGTRVRFRHPLVRSAVYRAARPEDRRRAHGALSAATDAALDPDRRAWHSAQSVLGVDEAVASDLERSAQRARARGGYAAAGAFLRRAAELSGVPADRTRRSLEAAHALHSAGDSEAALQLLTISEGGAPSAAEHARIQLLRAQIAFHLTRGADAPEMLLDAATTLETFDPPLSRETYLHALDAAVISGIPGTESIARKALTAPAAAEARPVDLLLDALATTMVHGFPHGVPRLRAALDALGGAAEVVARPAQEGERWLWLAGRIAVGILDDVRAHELAARAATVARRTGALADLPAALNLHANILVLSGDLRRAGALADEAEAITDSIGGVRLHHAHAILAGWRGDRAGLEEVNSLTFAQGSNTPGSGEAALAHYASAVLHNGLGEYSAAQEAAARTCGTAELSLSTIGLPELIEASVRAGDQESAAYALERFRSRARASGTAWALGLEARSRALTLTGSEAEEAYLEALTYLGRSRISGEAARAHLVYGEWLRREGRRQEARRHLRAAHEQFSEMGVEAFAARAAHEMRATGQHPRKRTSRRTDDLTAQELHIARLVSTGATSREVGAQLYLSPRTIESHLRSIFKKLDITSRRQLRDLHLA